MYKQIYISLLAVFFFTTVHAQEKKYVYQDTALIEEEQADTVTTTVTTQTVPYENPGSYPDEVKTLDTTLYPNDIAVSADSIAAWQNNKAFAYTRYLDSLLKDKKNKEKPKESSYRPSGSGNGWLNGVLSSYGTQVFFWILAACFVLFILYKLFLTQGAFRRTSADKTTIEPQVAEEVITPESDFDKMIRQATEAGNFRLAVRYQYLKSLHALALQQRISMAADKTNYQYVQEIANAGLRNDFASLTLNYEYIWYGEFMIDDILYQILAISFSDFNKKI